MLTHDCGRQGHTVRLRAFVGGAILVCLASTESVARAQAASALAAGDDRIGRLARAASGSIEGVVQNDAGQPLPGATVAALGLTNAASVTDGRGRFALRLLPAGSYVVRAHLSGFVPSRRQLVDVRPNGYTRHTFSLQREMIQTASMGADPAVLKVALGATTTGSMSGADRSGGAAEPITPATDDHSEMAWRLRHLTRSVLKDTTDRMALGDPASEMPAVAADFSTVVGRFLGSTTRAAATFFNTYPLAGEFNLLTTGALGDPLTAFSPQSLANSVAFVSLRGPASNRGDWSAKVVMAQAELSSWFVAGAYRSRAPGRHVFDVGASYSLLRYSARQAGPTTSFWSRSAGSLYGIDRWRLAPYLSVTYGGSFSSYDYLPGIGYLSPRASVTFMPVSRLRIQTTVARSVVAPGSEEFLQPLAERLWVPAPRPFVTIGATPSTPVERVRHYEVSVERDLTAHYVLAFRTFYQQVIDQQSTLFGSWPTFPVAGQQYTVSAAGDMTTRGWSVGLSNAITGRLRGSIWYALTESTWGALHDDEIVAILALRGGRAGATERLHDITTQVETEIPGTATRVFVVYKINTGFARALNDSIRPALDTRFDVQVSQRLPFLDFTSAQWQVLFAVRNLFREAGNESSVYDELLVVRPSKRIVGGLVVRF